MKNYLLTSIMLALSFVLLFSQCDKSDDNPDENDNQKPTAAFTVTPETGSLQTVFSFDASTSSDQETAAEDLLIKWDFEGDGSWDTDFSTEKTITHQYPNTGTFDPALQVMDEDGQTAESSKEVNVTGTGNEPSAMIAVNPENGDTGTEFTFNASGSTDEETPTSDLSVRWDFEGDGNWDTDFSTFKIIKHTYTEAGNFNASVEVKDEDGLTDMAAVLIEVSGGAGPDCPESFTDPRDGKEYTAVAIGDQCWMAENLNVGTMISGSQDPTNNGTIEKFCYDNNASNCDQYGGLYSWDEMMQYSDEESTQGICPDGWHLPSDMEFMALEIEVGLSFDEATSSGLRGSDEGYKLQSGGDSGFEALLAGMKMTENQFFNLNSYAVFFTSTENTQNLSQARYLFTDNGQILRNPFEKTHAYSVRCLKDSE